MVLPYSPDHPAPFLILTNSNSSQSYLADYERIYFALAAVKDARWLQTSLI
jgi:hypothetical protein